MAGKPDGPILPTESFWDIPLKDLLARLAATPDGLSTDEAARRLRAYGPNSLAKESRFAVVMDFFRFFANPLVLILLVASGVSFALGERIDALIIVTIVLLSVLMNFYQEFQARNAIKSLRQKVASTATTLRDGKEQEIPLADLVPGDVIILKAGDLVPADGRLFSVKDLHMRESALTGESLPVEKTADDLPAGTDAIADADNSAFMGTDVQSGIGRAVITRTGRATPFGTIAARLVQRPLETEFDRGIRGFGMMVTRVILALVLFVFLVNVVFRRPFMESFLFAVALAVGLTPELLPVIISVTLAKGARRMARKKVIVKQLASIENLGSMEILCSDKTGTLTEDEIVLDKHVDLTGEDDGRVLELIYVNSYFEASIKSPLDDAVLRHDHPNIDEYKKVDEVPFDFTRKRLTVAVERAGRRMLISKGEAESVFTVCTTVQTGEVLLPFDDERRKIAEGTYHALSADGYRVLGVAIKEVDTKEVYGKDDERDMSLVGFAAFLDPPKKDVGKTLEALKRDGISVTIMTGDNEYITRKVARDVGLSSDNTVTGTQLNGMDNAAIAYHAEQGAIFARVSPDQKNRIITALKQRGRVVGFLGDGINDAPALHNADVGISVVNGVDVAKEAANITLLEKDLAVLHDGVIEGRRSFANIMKYITMGTSSNFGNMFSMAAASLFLKFLPMLPTQILLNNFLYDASQIAIPSDNVEGELLLRPKRWRVDFIRQFMVIMGPISSIYDFLTFAVLIYFFHAGETLFHTGWFVESIATQTLVVFVIRTAGNPFGGRSRPSVQLTATVLGIVLISAVVPYTPIGALLGLAPLPALLLIAIAVLTVTYLALVQAVKVWFYRRHALI